VSAGIVWLVAAASEPCECRAAVVRTCRFCRVIQVASCDRLACRHAEWWLCIFMSFHSCQLQCHNQLLPE